MSLVVTGIAPTSDVGALAAALAAEGLATDHIQVVEPGDEDAPLAHGIVSAPRIGSLETGTGVPGLTSGNTSTTSREFFRDESLTDRLSDFEIPDDEIDNYLEALGAGRSVVAYFAKDETVDRVEAAFRTAGLAKVKRF